ncbi:MAG: hypothetical protein J6C44_04395 [Muribaculaceae bacterium]|nr:hypothetical protein [Muribaculaceae bacterium]
MKKTYTTFLTAIFISILRCGIIPTGCYAIKYNSAPRDYSIVPPAPQVAALMEFKDYPVDYFRGTPQINFPLYVLKVGQIEVPITLSYHGGGIKVGQPIGNVGLGWSVSCGASISRTVYGAPDEAYQYENLHGLWRLDDDEKNFRRQLITKVADYDPTDVAKYKINRSWQSTLGRRYYEGLTDVANDLYSLYGQGLSATFALPSQGNCIVSSETPLRIETNSHFNSNIHGSYSPWAFIVSTNDGLTYQFCTQEGTKYVYKHGNPELTQMEDSLYYASTWYLNNITDLCGNTVSFDYSPNVTNVRKSIGHSVAYGYSNHDLAERSPIDVSSCSSIEYKAKTLSQIEGNDITIVFSYYPALNTGERLIKSIIINTPDADERKIQFSYRGGYLSEVIDQGEVIYRFSYHASDGGSSSLGNGKDFGGYYNGGDDVTNIPYVIFSSGTVGFGADRDIDPAYSSKESLKRIEYATGGFTEFEWESNTFSHINEIPFYGKINDTKVTKIETDTLRGTDEIPYRKLFIKNWRLNKGQTAQLDLTHYFDMNPDILLMSEYEHSHQTDHYSETIPYNYPRVIIREQSTGKIVDVYFIDKETVEPGGIKTATDLHLSPGVYDIELKDPKKVAGAEYHMDLNFRYYGYGVGNVYLRKISTDNNEPRGHENWCGVRIKRIISCAGTNENDTLRKDFYYNRSGNPTESSGTVQMLPKYDWMYYKMFPCADVPGYEGSEIYCVGASAFPQTPFGALSTIEYPVVSTCMGRKERLDSESYIHNLWNTYYYSSSRDNSINDINRSDFKEYQPIGARIYTSMAHRRGNLLKKISNLSGTLQSEYAYNIYQDDNLVTLTTDAFTVCDLRNALGLNAYGGYDYSIGRYHIIPYNKTIRYERTTKHNGADSYKRYDYFYNQYTSNLDWNLPKSVTVSDSEHGETKTFYTYTRGEKNFLPLPETEITLRGDKILSATRTEYNVASLPIRKYTLSARVDTNFVLSQSQQTTPSQINSLNYLTYEYRYNSRGNLIQISYRGQPLASYIWGYNGLYPIIEASAVDYETLVNTAALSGTSQAQIEGLTITTDSKVSALAQSLRDKLPHSNITAISYHWLLGLAKFYTPRNDKSSFSYDPRGRLVEVRDFNNYLINKYSYHYENTIDVENENNGDENEDE